MFRLSYFQYSICYLLSICCYLFQYIPYRYKLHITKQSNNLIKEIETYKYRQTRDGEVLEEPVDFNDDAIAAMRYGIYSHWGRAAQYTQLIT